MALGEAIQTGNKGPEDQKRHNGPEERKQCFFFAAAHVELKPLISSQIWKKQADAAHCLTVNILLYT